MRRLLPVLSCLALAGCVVLDDRGSDGDGDDGSPPDAGPIEPRPDAGPGPDRFDCAPDDAEETYPVRVAGTVVDHATGEPIAGAEVAVGSAWHLGGGLPQECPPLATLTTSEDGRFGPATVDVTSPLFAPPYVIFMVTGEGLAPTASDQTMDCVDLECAPIEDHVVAAPSGALATEWRQELERGGMEGAGTRGLVLFAFTNLDGSPAENVVLWEGFFEEDALDPDQEVRFLAADRTTLAPTSAITTAGSGLALIGIGSEEPDQTDSAFIRGTRVADHWEVTGVLHDPGWIFVEDNQQDP
ncbi:MAG TPA: carboxypeptidase-like regulatory domain-containing protein [Kofleriaceae bacterium]|nr:carboxypeptidase-like regulatory domain-containing protein [Kofleriaceae bacterium]